MERHERKLAEHYQKRINDIEQDVDDLLAHYKKGQDFVREMGRESMPDNQGLRDRQPEIRERAVWAVKAYVGGRWNNDGDGLRGDQFRAQLKSDVDHFLEWLSAKLKLIVSKEHIHILKWDEIEKAARDQADRQVQRPDLCGPGPSLWVDGNKTRPPARPRNRKKTQHSRTPLSDDEMYDLDTKTRVAVFRDEFLGKGEKDIARKVCQKMDKLERRLPRKTKWEKDGTWMDAYRKHTGAVKTWISRAHISLPK